MNKRIFLTQDGFKNLSDVHQWIAYIKLTRVVKQLDKQVIELSVAKAIKTKRLHNKGQQLSNLYEKHQSNADRLDSIETELNTRREGYASGGRSSHQNTAGDIINLIRFFWNTYQDGDRPSHSELVNLFWNAVPSSIVAEATIGKWNTAGRKAWKLERQNFVRFENIMRFYHRYPTGEFSD